MNNNPNPISPNPYQPGLLTSSTSGNLQLHGSNYLGQPTVNRWPAGFSIMTTKVGRSLVGLTAGAYLAPQTEDEA